MGVPHTLWHHAVYQDSRGQEMVLTLPPLLTSKPAIRWSTPIHLEDHTSVHRDSYTVTQIYTLILGQMWSLSLRKKLMLLNVIYELWSFHAGLYPKAL